MITILRTLKSFPEQRVFTVLNDYFFHPDNEISSEAMRSSAHRTNESAIPHLLHIVEGGKQAQKIEALQVLSSIHAPLVIEQLLNYFTMFEDGALKQELLKTMNAILPFQEKILELNRGVLTNNSDDEELCKIAIRGLITAEDFDFLDYYLLHAPQAVQLEAFQAVYSSQSKKVQMFLKKLESDAKNLAELARAAYLAAYHLRLQNPNTSFSLRLLADAPKQVYLTFVQLLNSHVESSVSPKGIYRYLLLLPFVDTEVEIIISEMIKKILNLKTRDTRGTSNELRSITTVHLDQVFRKVKENHISLRQVKKKEDLIPTLFASLIEKYCSTSFLEEMRKFFRAHERGDPTLLIEAMQECLSDAEGGEINGFKACVPLFLEKDKKKRLRINSFINKIDPQLTNMLRRLNRLIKAAGFLQIKSLVKTIYEIRLFAIAEKISFLEEASTISLCQLASNDIAREIRTICQQLETKKDVFKSYVRGAQYLPPETVAESILNLLFHNKKDPVIIDLAIDSLRNMDLRNIHAVDAKLLRAFEAEEFDKSQREKIAEIIAKHGDAASFQPLIEFLSKGDSFTKIIGIRMIKAIGIRKKDVPLDVLTGKLYKLIEDDDLEVRVEALIALLALGDDYAERIVGDWLESDDEYLIEGLLSRFQERITGNILPHILGLLNSEQPLVHASLRDFLPTLSKGPFAGEVKKALIEGLSASPETMQKKRERIKKEERLKSKDIFLHPKLEYKLRREHSQILTVFFIDMVGYTKISTQSDMTNLMKLIKTFEGNVVPSMATYNGLIVKKLGDGILAVFKHPVSAAIAALEIQSKINEYNRYAVDKEKFQVRIGLHQGTVIWKENDIFGDVVNTASRMETSAKPGEILITEEMYNDIRDFITCEPRGELQVKGKEVPIKAFYPTGVEKDVKALLEIRKTNLRSFIAGDSNTVLDRLKEAFFAPRFEIPTGVSKTLKDPSTVVSLLHTLFTDMAEAASEISHDYHEEFLFKQYLQEKWDETISNLKKFG